MKLEWRDMTSYSRGDYGKVPPSILRTKIEDIEISIHRHIHYPDTWLLTCHKLNIKAKDLFTNDFKQAEKLAITYIIDNLQKYIKLKNKLSKLLNNYT